MSSKSKNVVKTQYVYVNSKNVVTDPPYQIKLTIPRGFLQCDSQSQFFKLSVQNFQMTRSWYFVNQTNNRFIIKFIIDPYVIEIDEGNYTYKQLASAIATKISQSSIPDKALISVVWDSKINKLVFTFPDSVFYTLDFATSNSASYVMGFDAEQYTPNASLQIVSTYILPATLSKSLTLWIDNLTPNKDYLSLENKNGSVCEPCTSIMNINNNFAPFDVISWENTNGDLYSIIVNEKQLDNLTFSIRNENGQLMQYVSDWRASIRVETLSDDDSYNQQIEMLQELKDIKEYLRYTFVKNNL